MRETPRQVAAWVGLLVVCLSLVAPALASPVDRTSVDRGAASGAALAGSPSTAQQAPFAQSRVDPDVVAMRAVVRENGTAEWTVEFRVRLDDENATAAFESVQTDVEENSTAFTSQFADGMGRTVASAENGTGREMALSNVTVTATTERLPQEYGVLTYRFTWSSFAAVDGEEIRIGDSLSGFFLDGESSLALEWPAGYEAESVTPQPDDRGNNSVTWRGSADFGPNEPRVVTTPASGSFPIVALAAVGLVAVAALGGGWLYVSRDDDGAGAADDGAAIADGASADDASATASGDGGTDESDDSGRDEPPAELLSNEERVIRLLEDNGGRIKQQQIAGEFDWTDAKTSQVVGNLRDDDAVETFRIGRENVVALPEESDL